MNNISIIIRILFAVTIFQHERADRLIGEVKDMFNSISVEGWRINQSPQ